MKRNAFTLIELSIALVIIGLIVGGVLVGRDLIRSTEQRSFIGQLGETKAAINTFRLEYDCLVADCPDATAFFGKNATLCNSDTGVVGSPGVCNGDGNKAIDTSIERDFSWLHLIAAGLVSYEYYDDPDATNQPKPDYFNVEADGGMRLRTSSNKINIFFQTLSQIHEEVVLLDQKIDDGKANDGNMRAREVAGAYPSEPTGCTDASGDYAPISIGIYDDGCDLFFAVE